jgi:hypothetical protein
VLKYGDTFSVFSRYRDHRSFGALAIRAFPLLLQDAWDCRRESPILRFPGLGQSVRRERLGKTTERLGPCFTFPASLFGRASRSAVAFRLRFFLSRLIALQ